MADWTPTMQAALEAGWAAGDTAEVIGERIGVTRNAVIGRARRSPNCIPRQNPTVHGFKRPKRAPSAFKREAGSGVIRQTLVEATPTTLPALRLVAAVSAHGPRACCWPFGDPGTPEFRFSCEPVSRRSYCAVHHAVAYVPTRRQETADAA